MILLWVPFILLILLLLWLVLTYNGLVRLKNLLKEAWSGIDVQLRRRYDLIPNVVESVKGYAAHEREVFEKVAEARSAAMGAKTPAQKGKAEDALTGTLKTLFAVSENYPQLRASENFLSLQNELDKIEEQLQLTRRYYNTTARDYNIKVQSFPNNLIAGPFGFAKEEFFEVTEPEVKEAPKVSFTRS